MRDSRAFDAYVRTCDQGEPWVEEITYDTPFGDGYMLGTFAHRVTKLGDGVMVFLTDITEQRRMEAELRGYADVVAHDLREPVANMSMLVRMLEQSADQRPQEEVLQMLREGIGRAQELIEAVLGYARLGELRSERVALGRADARGRRGPRSQPDRSRRDVWTWASCPRWTATPSSCAGCFRTWSATR